MKVKELKIKNKTSIHEDVLLLDNYWEVKDTILFTDEIVKRFQQKVTKTEQK